MPGRFEATLVTSRNLKSIISFKMLVPGDRTFNVLFECGMFHRVCFVCDCVRDCCADVCRYLPCVCVMRAQTLCLSACLPASLHACVRACVRVCVRALVSCASVRVNVSLCHFRAVPVSPLVSPLPSPLRPPFLAPPIVNASTPSPCKPAPIFCQAIPLQLSEATSTPHPRPPTAG